MGQQEVLNFIRKHRGRWFTSKQIATRLKSSIGSVTCNLAKLRRTRYIEFKEQKGKSQGNRGYLYRVR